MEGTLNGIKADVKSLYAAIVRQALVDWKRAVKRDDRGAKNEIRRFFRSDWGKIILDTLELDFKVINDKYHIFN